MTRPRTDSASHTRNHAGQAFTITAKDGALLRATLFGKPTAAATIVYLHAPLSDETCFGPLINQLDESFAGNIAQLTFRQRGHGSTTALRTGRAGMSQLVDDLNAVLGHATGQVVLVVHSLAAVLLQGWLHHGRHDAPRVHAIVAIAPVTELPDHAGALTAHPSTAARQAGDQLIGELATALGADDIRGEAAFESARQTLRTYRRCGTDLAVVEDLLRATPTWIVAGRRDEVAAYTRVEELATTVWAELIVVPDAAHDLIHTHHLVAALAVVEAFDAVIDLIEYGGGR
ncbi:alpha/beta hydrolase [Nocardia salmonicida]|uniref:alpha/beta hydrolase n=1 Tax=Nocardia salmonicida TaxID=53431 RepID=UPI003CE84CE8